LEATASLTPPLVSATTENVYAVPFVRPVTTVGLVTSVSTDPPGSTKIAYETGSPPLYAGACQATVAFASPGVAVTFLGSSGSARTSAKPPR
jgi:hypothetical protein